MVVVAEARGVPNAPELVTLGLAKGSGVALGVLGSRVGIGPWVGVFGTGRLGSVSMAGGEVGVGAPVGIARVGMGAGGIWKIIGRTSRLSEPAQYRANIPPNATPRQP